MDRGSGHFIKGETVSNDFALKEYELCFEHHRFYDNRQFDLLKYLISLATAVATAQFAVYRIVNGTTSEFFVCQFFLSVVVFIATLLLYLAMLQNRLYFVLMSRQLNAIRGYWLALDSERFDNNQLYTKTNISAFKLSSVHTFQMIGAVVISAMFAALSAYSMAPLSGGAPCFLSAIITFILVAFVEVVGGVSYLISNDGKTADQAIH